MTDSLKKEDSKVLPPGVCFPWEKKVQEIEPILGNEALIKNEWEKLDTFAYLYLWYWVHR